MKKHLSTIVLVAVFVVGLCLILYPSVSDWWNQQHATQAIASYDETVSQLSKQDTESLFDAADEYNEKLAADSSAFYAPDSIAGYDDLLNPAGTGMMGYVTIDKINVRLPVYHGTEDSVLTIGAGHLKGTSLPVGGTSTHCVISGHRGLPSAKLFTDLDQLEVGDTFVITTLNRKLTYEVDNISIVEPTEVDQLQIVDGLDLCTLMTCTPYGVNDHRLLVRGHRIENADSGSIAADAVQIDPTVVASVIAVPILVVLLAAVLIRTRARKSKGE